MTDVLPQSTDPDDDVHSDSPRIDSLDTSSIASYPGVPIQMFPFGVISQSPIRSKRRQVKNACTHCQKACKKCDDARPCLRCVKYGIGEECVDSQRKERKKGVKRGPYKKRDGKNRAASTSVEPPLDGAVAQGVNMPPPPMHPPGPPPPPPGPYLSSIPYPAFYGQYPPMPPHGPRPTEMPTHYPSYYVSVPHVPPHYPGGQEHEHAPYPPPQFYPPFVSPYGPPYAPSYMFPHRPDMPMAMMPTPYAHYPPPYTRPPSVAGHGPDVMAGPAHMIRREDVFDARPPELIGMEGRA